MTFRYTITAARGQDIGMLAAIERAAASLLAGHAPESVLNETTSQDVLEKARRNGLLWVVLADDVPVGFAHVEVIEPDCAHLEEIDVHPEHGRRGLGRSLVRHVCGWAAAAGYQLVSLTTFRDVAWNMPFYAQLGFDVVPADELSPMLRAIVEDETRRGLDPSRRVVMRWSSSGAVRSNADQGAERQVMEDPNVLKSDNANPEDLQFLEEQVNEYNFATTGIRDARLLVILLRDSAGRIYAGLSGHTWGGVGEIRFLWVDETRRHTGIGSRLLRAAEDEAHSRGCRKIVLSTHSFQAPDFYRKRGYVVTGEFSNYPQGHSSIFLEKPLASTTRSDSAAGRHHEEAARRPRTEPRDV